VDAIKTTKGDPTVINGAGKRINLSRVLRLYIAKKAAHKDSLFILNLRIF